MNPLHLTAALASCIVVTSPSISVLEKAVSLKGVLRAKGATAGDALVAIQIDIVEGWHIYDEVGAGSEVRTSLRLQLQEGVAAVGEWSRPVGVAGAPDSRVYHGRVSFEASVSIDPIAYGEEIGVTVSYQACNDDRCNPPQTKTVRIAIPEEGLPVSGLFEPPVRLKAQGALLNSAGKNRFLSPGVFDVDGDGKDELVIGELMGRMGVFENLNTTGEGDPVWSSHAPLRAAGGEPIRTSNW